MQLNYIGIIAALTAFLSIWIGHVSVRKIEAASRTIWLPTVIAVGLGLMLEYWSLVTDYNYYFIPNWQTCKPNRVAINNKTTGKTTLW